MKKITLLLALLSLAVLCAGLSGCKSGGKQASSKESPAGSGAHGGAGVSSWSAEEAEKAIVKRYPRRNLNLSDLALCDQKDNRQYPPYSPKASFDQTGMGEASAPYAPGTAGYFGADVSFQNDKLRGYTLFDKAGTRERFCLKNGVTIGSSQEEVLGAFGSPTDGAATGPFYYVYYQDGDKLTISDPDQEQPLAGQDDTSKYFYLTVMFENDKVFTILAGDFAYMNSSGD